MSLKFIDGFDHYNIADITSKWSGVGGTSTLSFSTGRFGGQAVTWGNLSSLSYIFKSFSTNYSTVVAGGAYFTTLAPTSLLEIIGFFDSGTEQISVLLDSDMTVKFGRGGSALTQTNSGSYGALTINVWNYIEIEVNINTSVGSSTCKIYVNGLLYTTLNSGQNTNPSSSGTVNRFYLFNGSTAFDFVNTHKWDDVYFAEVDGSDITGPLGDSKVETLYPASAGTNTTWTPDTGSNYARVNETHADGDTSYVLSDTVTDSDTYTFADLGTTATTVHAIQVTLWSRKDSSGTREIEAAIYTGSTVYNGSAESPMFSTYVAFCSIFRTNPHTSAAWTTSDINSAEYGMTVST